MLSAIDELVQAGGNIATFFTADEITSYKDYVRPLIIKHLVDLGLTLVEFGLIFALGLNRKLMEACKRWTASVAARVGTQGTLYRLGQIMQRLWKGEGWGASVLFVWALTGILMLLDLPGDLYFGYFREKALGLTNQSLPSYLGDMIKGVIAGDIALGMLVFGLYGLMRRFRAWWAILGAVAVFGMLVSGFFDPYRNKLNFETHSLEAGPLRTKLESLLKHADVPFQDIKIINGSRATTRADAYFAGQGATREIVIFDTMLDKYTPEEIAVAVAHEIGHLREDVVSRKVISALLMVPLLFLFHLALALGGRSGKLGFDGETDVAGLPLIMLLFFLITLVSTPFSSGGQRERESAADAVALELTQAPDALMTLMTKLAKQNKADPVPEPLVEGWLANHPAVARRLAMGYRFKAAHPNAVPFAYEAQAAVGATAAAPARP